MHYGQALGGPSIIVFLLQIISLTVNVSMQAGLVLNTLDFLFYSLNLFLLLGLAVQCNHAASKLFQGDVGNAGQWAL